MDSAESIPDFVWALAEKVERLPTWALAGFLVIGSFCVLAALIYLTLILVAPAPRPPTKAEKQYITVDANGSVSQPQSMPCWYDTYAAKREVAQQSPTPTANTYEIEDAEIFMTLAVPAYNEEERMSGMLEEAVEYLEQEYGTTKTNSKANGTAKSDPKKGWEILVISDGSTDQTVETALKFARTHQTASPPPAPKGPWNTSSKPTSISPGSIRVVQLEKNRGKGGAVTHGMRHARGSYVVFADADGASRFSDLGSLVKGCEKAQDKLGRAVGVGSRAHMVGTEAVVKRSLLRNTLMRAFHLLIRALTTPQTAQIRDTQCGFKLFTRASLPYIVPFMHTEGWIFDVEMLMLAESAEIPMVEVPIGWKEVKGSKLNVIKDSVGMAVGLAMLRVCWGTGVFSRD